MAGDLYSPRTGDFVLALGEFALRLDKELPIIVGNAVNTYLNQTQMLLSPEAASLYVKDISEFNKSAEK